MKLITELTIYTTDEEVNPNLRSVLPTKSLLNLFNWSDLRGVCRISKLELIPLDDIRPKTKRRKHGEYNRDETIVQFSRNIIK